MLKIGDCCDCFEIKINAAEESEYIFVSEWKIVTVLSLCIARNLVDCLHWEILLIVETFD